MKREVIQDFLNLPGIASIALMDGRSRPYFYGVDQTLNFQQKEALAQGILRVVETIPDGFETFEFEFTGHEVYIYKLEHGIVLLVLTRNDLVYSDYLRIIKNLRAVLKEDISNAIATFRLIAGNMTLSGTSYRKTGTDSLSNSGITTRSSDRTPRPQPTSLVKETISGSPADFLPTVDSKSAIGPINSSSSSTAGDTTLKDLLTALNQLSKFTTEYLGTHVIVNYWKSTRPETDWLSNFQIDRSARFTFTGAPSQGQHIALSSQEQQWVREWVAAFTKRCSQVIRDFPNIVQQKALSEEQKTLLLDDE